MTVIPRQTAFAAQSSILAKKLAKLLLDQALRGQVRMLRLLRAVDFPVPTYTQLLGIGSHSIRHYYESGVNCYLPIAVAALQARIDLHDEIKVLDFGCGAGRQLLHFTRRFPRPAYHACDVNEPAVRFVKTHYPQVRAWQNEFRPPLPLASDALDMVYSVSVFSHLDPGDQELWLRELARVTRPGGCCFLTTEGPTAIGRISHPELPQDPAARRRLLAGRGLIFLGYPDLAAHKENERLVRFGSKYAGIEGAYGTTIMSPAYIADRWPAFGFALEAVLEGIIDHRQDLVVLRRA